jgi:hypothetical protein
MSFRESYRPEYHRYHALQADTSRSLLLYCYAVNAQSQPNTAQLNRQTLATSSDLLGSNGATEADHEFDHGSGIQLNKLTPLQSLAQVRRRSWAPNCSMPICFDDGSTAD